MLTYSQNDPQLMSKLLALQEKDTEHETVCLILQFETLHIEPSLCAYN